MKKFTFYLFLLYLLWSTHSYAQQIEWACRVVETNDQSTKEYGPSGILGVPNVYPLEKTGTSWCMGYTGKEESRGEVFVKLHFCKPVLAKQVLIVENLNPGAIKAVYIYDTKMNEKLIYHTSFNKDTNHHRILTIPIDSLQGPVNYIKILAQPSFIDGINCIDAVGITASKDPVSLAVNLDKEATFAPSFQFLNGNINTVYDEYSPVVTPDGKTLYFARLGDPHNKAGRYGDIDIWASKQDESGQWMRAENVGSPLNNTNHNFVASIVNNGQALFLGTTYGPNGKSLGEGCSISRKISDKWSFPKNVNLKDFYNDNAHVSFFLSNDMKVLLMSIEDNDHSFGEQDIYVSFLRSDETWSSPVNVGPSINTVNSESNVFLSPDMSTMYFSSNGYLGYGGHDIFKSKRLDSSWQNWSKPVNLGPIVNSENDELCFVTTADGKFGYGYRHYNDQQKNDIFMIGFNNKKASNKADSTVGISGIVSEVRTGTRIAAKISVINPISSKETGISVSEPGTGQYEIILPKDSVFSISVHAPGYMPVNVIVRMPIKSQYQEVIKNIGLIPIEIGESFNLTNVFFHKGTPFLTETSYLELNHIFQFLKDNPTVTIRLEGHTDNQGDPTANIKLSEERVKTVKEYLVKYGINTKRIEFKAFGGNMPVASNSQEETRKLNRRVEFVITRK